MTIMCVCVWRVLIELLINTSRTQSFWLRNDEIQATGVTSHNYHSNPVSPLYLKWVIIVPNPCEVRMRVMFGQQSSSLVLYFLSQISFSLITGMDSDTTKNKPK